MWTVRRRWVVFLMLSLLFFFNRAQNLKYMRHHGKRRDHGYRHSHRPAETPSVKGAPSITCYNGTCNSIVTLAQSKRLQPGSTLPLVFANRDYWPVVLNGLVAQSRIEPSLPFQVGIVCLDDTIARWLRNAGAPPCYRLRDETVQKSLEKSNGAGEKMDALWMVRITEAVRLLEKMKIGVLFFDADAVWQRDLRTITETLQVDRYDVVASRGTFPHDIEKHWGATLCMGCIYFAPTKASLILLENMLKYVPRGKTFDDQIAINRALLEAANLKWNSSVPLSYSSTLSSMPMRNSQRARKLLRHRGRAYSRAHSARHAGFLHPTRGPKKLDIGYGYFPVKGYTNNTILIKVGLLPHAIVPRRCDELSVSELRSAAVLHCYCAKTGRAKREAGRRYKTWFLPESPQAHGPEEDAYAATAAFLFRKDAYGKAKLLDQA